MESWSEDLLAVLDAEGWQRFAVSGARSTFGDSEEVVAAAPRAQLVAVHGLSHRRTARDPEVVAGIADFVTAN